MQGPDLSIGFIGEFTNTSGSTRCQPAIGRGLGRTDFNTCMPSQNECDCLPGRIPPDCKLPPIYLNYNDSVAILLVTFNGLALATTIFVAIFLVCHRSHPVVKGASLVFCLQILLGIIIGLSTIFVLIGKLTAIRCTLYAWLNAISFGFIMINLLVKTWRVYKIFFFILEVSPGQLSEKRMIFRALMYISVQAIVLGVVTLLYPIGTEIDLIENDPFAQRRLVCGEALEVSITTIIWNVLYLAIGFALLYKTRQVRTDQFGESPYIIYVLLFSGAIVPGVALTLGMTGRARLLFNIISTGTTSVLALGTVFFPKVYGVIFNESFDGQKFLTEQKDHNAADLSFFDRKGKFRRSSLFPRNTQEIVPRKTSLSSTDGFAMLLRSSHSMSSHQSPYALERCSISSSNSIQMDDETAVNKNNTDGNDNFLMKDYSELPNTSQHRRYDSSSKLLLGNDDDIDKETSTDYDNDGDDQSVKDSHDYITIHESAQRRSMVSSTNDSFTAKDINTHDCQSSTICGVNTCIENQRTTLRNCPKSGMQKSNTAARMDLYRKRHAGWDSESRRITLSRKRDPVSNIKEVEHLENLTQEVGKTNSSHESRQGMEAWQHTEPECNSILRLTTVLGEEGARELEALLIRRVQTLGAVKVKQLLGLNVTEGSCEDGKDISFQENTHSFQRGSRQTLSQKARQVAKQLNEAKAMRQRAMTAPQRPPPSKQENWEGESKAIFSFQDKDTGFRIEAGQTLLELDNSSQGVVIGKVRETGHIVAVPRYFLARLTDKGKRSQVRFISIIAIDGCNSLHTGSNAVFQHDLIQYLL